MTSNQKAFDTRLSRKSSLHYKDYGISGDPACARFLQGREAGLVAITGRAVALRPDRRAWPRTLLHSILSNIEPVHLRRVSKEACWIVVGQALVVSGALLGIRILTSLLEPAQYGDLALGLTLATLVNQVLMGPLAAGFSRFFAPAAENAQLGSYLKGLRQLTLAASICILMLAVVLAAALFAAGQTRWLGLSLASFVFALVAGWSSIFNGIQNAARHRAVVALHQGLDVWIRFSLAAGLILWLGRSSTVATVGYAIGSFLVLISQLIFFARLVAPFSAQAQGPGTWRAQVWNYSWPFAAWGIFYWGQSASDRWALATFVSPHDVGLYAALFQLSYYPISLISGMSFQLLSPILFQRAGDARDARRTAEADQLGRHITFVVFGITGMAFLVAVILHRQVFAIFVGIKFQEVSYLLPWALLAGGLFSAGQSVALRFMAQLQSRELIPVNVGIAIAGIAANFAGAYCAGIKGVVVASLLTSAGYFSLMCWRAARTV